MVVSGDGRSVTKGTTSGGYAGVRSTVSHSSGLFLASFWKGPGGVQWESASSTVGFASASASLTGGVNDPQVVQIDREGRVWQNGGIIATYGNLANRLGDRIDAVYDFSNTKTYWRRNEGWWNDSATADPATNTGGLSHAALTGAVYAMVFLYFTANQQCRSSLIDPLPAGGATYPWG